MEIERLRRRPAAVVDYPTPPSNAFANNILGVTGNVCLTVGQNSFLLGLSDCVAARIDRPTHLEVLRADPAECLVAVDGANQ